MQGVNFRYKNIARAITPAKRKYNNLYNITVLPLKVFYYSNILNEKTQEKQPARFSLRAVKLSILFTSFFDNEFCFAVKEIYILVRNRECNVAIHSRCIMWIYL